MENMWANILTKPLQGKVFRVFRAKLMNCPVEYEEKITCEDAENTTGVYNKNYVQTVRTNTQKISYAEATGATIKSPMTLPQECVGATRNPVVSGMSQRMGFPRVMVLYFLSAVMEDLLQSDRIYNYNHVY